MESSSVWSQCGVVLQVQAPSATLDFRSYAEPVGEQSVLQWAIGELTETTGVRASFEVLTDPCERDRVRGALAPWSEAAVTAAIGTGDLSDLGRIAARAPAARFLVGDLTLALMPAEVLHRVIQTHIADRNDATLVGGVPCSVMPALVEAGLIAELLRRNVPGLPATLRPALVALARAVAMMGGDAESFRIQQMNVVPGEWEDPRRPWPFHIQLRDPNDVCVLRRAVALRGRSATDVLGCWTGAVAAERAVRLEPLRTMRRAAAADPLDVRRVLFVQVPSALSGVERVVQLQAGSLPSNGHPSYTCAALIGTDGLFAAGLRDARVDVTVAERNFSSNLVEHHLYCRRELTRIRPDIVHTHGIAGVPFTCAVVDDGVPLIQHVHVAHAAGLERLDDQIAHASAVIAVSDFVKRQIMRLGVDPNKVHVVRNGVVPPSRSAVARPDVRTRCGVAAAAPVILMAARFSPNKRHDVALEAFSLLHHHRPDACLLLAGEAFEGDEGVLEHARRSTERLGVSGAVRFVGFWRDMQALYAAADVLLLPSEDDPLPLTVLEAMAAGLPVVAARSGGTPEMIEHRLTGTLVDPGDCRGFSEAILEMLDDEDLRSRIRSAAVDRCATAFTVTRFIADITRIYDAQLTHRSGAPDACRSMAGAVRGTS
jgi:glycosyltransferase involved in cell wall biosynthesis